MCDCIDKVNRHLAEHNTRVSAALGIDDEMNMIGRLIVATEKIDKRKKESRTMTATFCPFCGVVLGHDHFSPTTKETSNGT